METSQQHVQLDNMREYLLEWEPVIEVQDVFQLPY
jgi:hypothetical protein